MESSTSEARGITAAHVSDAGTAADSPVDSPQRNPQEAASVRVQSSGDGQMASNVRMMAAEEGIVEHSGSPSLSSSLSVSAKPQTALLMCGMNSNGQLGLGDFLARVSPQAPPTQHAIDFTSLSEFSPAV
eukprot:2146910-Pleurochrysis_carterae.AAC.2